MSDTDNKPEPRARTRNINQVVLFLEECKREGLSIQAAVRLAALAHGRWGDANDG